MKETVRNFINNIRDRKKMIGVWCITATLLCYLFSAMLFSHTHIIGDQIIRHSHPNSSTQHTHTTDEMQAFRDFVPLFAFFFLLAAAALFSTTVKEKFSDFSSKIHLAFTHFTYLRGPPATV